MGNVDIQWMKKGIGGGLNYALKYLTKLTRGLVDLPKRARVINAAHRLYEWYKKKKSRFTLVRKGNYDPDIGYLSPFWEIPCIKSDIEIEKQRQERNLIELLDYFEQKKRYKQMSLCF